MSYLNISVLSAAPLTLMEAEAPNDSEKPRMIILNESFLLSKQEKKDAAIPISKAHKPIPIKVCHIAKTLFLLPFLRKKIYVK